MKSIIQWFKDWKYKVVRWKYKIMISNDNIFKKRIEKLEIYNSQLRTDIKGFEKWEKKNLDEIEEMQLMQVASSRLIKMLVKTQIKPTRFKKVNVMYEWRPREWIKLREALNNFSQDEEYLSKYVGFCDELGIKDIEDIDSQVRHIVIKVLDWINGAYSSNYKSFGVGEYWLTVQEAFDHLVEQGKKADCDIVSNLIYGCIVATLIQQERWEENKKRLLRVDVKITGGTPHALLSWKRDSGIHCPIESTFYAKRFKRNWLEEDNIFKSMYVDVFHIFDEESEYKLVN